MSKHVPKIHCNFYGARACGAKHNHGSSVIDLTLVTCARCISVMQIQRLITLGKLWASYQTEQSLREQEADDRLLELVAQLEANLVEQLNSIVPNALWLVLTKDSAK